MLNYNYKNISTSNTREETVLLKEKSAGSNVQ